MTPGAETPSKGIGEKTPGSLGREMARLLRALARAERWNGLVDRSGDIEVNAAPDADAGNVDAAFRKHNQMLIRWLAQKLGDVETARDIAQGAYLRVLRYAQTQKVDNAQALIFKTAANLAANEFRSRKRKRILSADRSSADGEEAIDLVACPDPSPEDAALSRERMSATLEAIRALPDQIRRAFVLSRFEGKTYRDIAATLGVSESSVEKYIIAALKAVRAAVAEPAPSADVIPLAERRIRQ